MTTGTVYDSIFLKHTYPGHPEGAQRLEAITRILNEADLWPLLQQIPSRMATRKELEYAHQPRYIRRIEAISRRGGGHLNPDTYTTSNSYQAAGTAVGSLIDLTLAVNDGQIKNGFALVRPPGHHATQNQGMGFCLFSNIAIAAKAVQHQRGLERVAIVDFDVHHGNGTQAILDDDPTVFFNSSHQYPYYPGTGSATEIGRGQAKGSKVNFPLSVGVGDDGFKAIYTQILIPLLRRFQPQLMLVSAGYDAHWNDPLAQLGLSLTGLSWISETLISLAEELCQGKIVFTLEGGYNPEVLSNGVANTIRALLGQDDFVDPVGPSPWAGPDLSDYLRKIKKIHNIEKIITP